MKKLLEQILAGFTKAILNKYSPEVIAITGSVGKTTAKEAIYTVLKSTYSVRRNLKNYNNEIGVPLTVIGSDTGGRSAFKWALVFLKALFLLVIKNKNYPNILILEMGADHPGDIKKLCQLVGVKVGVVTEVSEAHTEFLGNLEDVAEEKGELIKSLPATGIAVLNYDNKFVHKMKDISKAPVVFYGLSEGADLNAKNITTEIKDLKVRTAFHVDNQGEEVEIILNNVLGDHLIYSALAAIAVGRSFDLDILTIAKSLEDLEIPQGRMRLIAGIKNTMLIDDTYNSSPLAVKKAILELAKIQSGNDKYAVLGDMLELGPLSEQLHQEIGQLIAMQNIDYLVTVGELSRDVIRGAVNANMSKDKCFNFKDSREAGLFLQNKIVPGDILLIKGSQSIRMERIIKELMAQPQKAKDLLVRQDKSWEKS